MRCRLIEVSTEESVTAIKATLSLMEPTSGTKDCTDTWRVGMCLSKAICPPSEKRVFKK
jgi:hypothetical protein